MLDSVLFLGASACRLLIDLSKWLLAQWTSVALTAPRLNADQAKIVMAGKRSSHRPALELFRTNDARVLQVVQ